MFLAEKLQHIFDEFSELDPQERLAAIVDRSKRIRSLPLEDRIDANRVHGCVSVVWLAAETRAGRCFFRGDAESPVVRALLLFLCEFFSGAPAAEIAASEVDPLDALGLTRTLSPTRRNGLAAARSAIRAFARTSLTTPLAP